MMRASLVLAVIGVLAVATPGGAQPPPNWQPDRGWQVPGLDDFETRTRAIREAHERRVAEMDRDFEENKARSQREFRTFAGVIFGFFGLVVVASLTAGAATQRRRRRYAGPALADDIPVVSMAAFSSTGGVDVTALRLAIDGRASKFVRSELDAIARTYAADDAETRARKLREVSVMLRRVRDSWIYGGADNEPMRPHAEALAAFTRLVDEARTRIRRPAQPAPTDAHPVSLMLVSVIVAARGELMTVTDLATGEDLRRALESAAYRGADEILALDVVWVPERDGETVSSIDLEAVYRRAELHPLEGATVGKVFCTYCGGPFPGELVSCPRCGGPAPGRERRA